MDKNAIKKYAIWARRELIERVSQRAMIYGITAKDAGDPNAESVNGHLLSPAEKQQRQALIQNIREKGYEQVMEEVAYTWFNRFAALRFMEVNAYLPSHIRVFTNDAGEFKPQILAEAIHLELDGLDMNKVYELERANKREELFKYLLIVQCNALSSILPGMFQRIEDYTELLLPDYLLREGSVIEQMVTTISETDWTDQVQIIGWLYQYYNTELKDKVFADLKKNIKITKENIPAATQLFTPDWIVHYMVENSLGRLWLEGHPNDALKSEWKYYLDEAEQEPEVQAQLTAIRKEYAALKPEEIRVIDPCMGSGHILCVLFDVLVRIYEDYGYTAREAAVKIVENNLWGLDIDERAAQLSYFAVMMKARQYDRRFFSRGIQPHVYAIVESNSFSREVVEYFCKGDATLSKAIQMILTELHDAKEYGSILTCSAQDWEALYARFDEVYDDISMHRDDVLDLLPLVQTAEALSQKYDVVVTNPPYMGAGGMSGKLSEYVKKKYPNSKGDLSTVCMEKCLSICKSQGFISLINIPVWMFLSSYQKLRIIFLTQNILVNMLHPGRGVFGSDFGSTAFVFCKGFVKGYIGSYRRLFDEQVEVKSSEIREKQFFDGKGAFHAQQDNFTRIPGVPVAYWICEQMFSVFSNNPVLNNIAPTKKGLDTGENEKFLRLWFEISFPLFGIGYTSSSDFSNNGMKWAPHDKGGDFRRWYGNKEWVINWGNDGFDLRNSKANLRSEKYYFSKAITWGTLSSGKINFRYSNYGAISNTAGSSIYADEDILFYLLALLNTPVSQYAIDIINPTINYSAGPVGQIPVILKNEVKNISVLSQENVILSQTDWDSFETSWDFKRHPLV